MEINSMYPDAEDLQLAFDREFAILRESMSNIEYLFKRILQSKVYVSDEELSSILKCKTNEIPAAIPRYRGSRRGYLYRLDEVNEYLESKRIPRRSK